MVRWTSGFAGWLLDPLLNLTLIAVRPRRPATRAQIDFSQALLSATIGSRHTPVLTPRNSALPTLPIDRPTERLIDRLSKVRSCSKSGLLVLIFLFLFLFLLFWFIIIIDSFLFPDFREAMPRSSDALAPDCFLCIALRRGIALQLRNEVANSNSSCILRGLRRVRATDYG